MPILISTVCKKHIIHPDTHAKLVSFHKKDVYFEDGSELVASFNGIPVL
jgi:hypothetical protein